MKLPIILLFLFFCCFGCIEKTNLGSVKNPIKIALVPGQDTDLLKFEGEKFSKYLAKETGLEFQIIVPVNYIAVVEALGSERADIALINTFGYVLANEKYKARAVLRCLNKGTDVYYGQIIAKKGRFKSISELNGKKFAFVDPASTSGYLLPSKLFLEKNIRPSETVFAGRHDNVISMLYQGQVDAGATFYSFPEDGVPRDARRLALQQYPDVFEKIEILEKTGPIPNDPIVFRSGITNDMENKIVSAMEKYSQTDDGKKNFKALYNFDGFRRAKDSDYDSVRQLLKSVGKTAQELIK